LGQNQRRSGDSLGGCIENKHHSELHLGLDSGGAGTLSVAEAVKVNMTLIPLRLGVVGDWTRSATTGATTMALHFTGARNHPYAQALNLYITKRCAQPLVTRQAPGDVLRARPLTFSFAKTLESSHVEAEEVFQLYAPVSLNVSWRD